MLVGAVTGSRVFNSLPTLLVHILVSSLSLSTFLPAR